MSSVKTSGVIPPGSTEALAVPKARDHKAISAVTIIACLVVLVIAGGAWMYFATDPFREPIKQESPVFSEGQEPRARAPEVSLAEGTKDASEAADNKFASALQPPRPPDPVESSNALPKPAPKTSSSMPSRTPHVQSPAQQAPGQPNKTASPASRRAAAAGTYETTSSTPLFEAPSANSAVIANIPGGMRLNVVNSAGDWLEVHSKRGNPPGYIRRQDATLISKAD